MYYFCIFIAYLKGPTLQKQTPDAWLLLIDRVVYITLTDVLTTLLAAAQVVTGSTINIDHIRLELVLCIQAY